VDLVDYYGMTIHQSGDAIADLRCHLILGKQFLYRPDHVIPVENLAPFLDFSFESVAQLRSAGEELGRSQRDGLAS